METPRESTLTLGEAAHRLDMAIDELLELVYSQQVPGRLQPDTGRLLLEERDVEQLERRRRTESAG